MSALNENARVWYFAYGSNMQGATFEGRRGMHPSEAMCARLDGYRLCFDLPVGPGERGVANLEVVAEAHVYGVIYSLSPAELSFLDRTEGVDRGYYERQKVLVTTLSGKRVGAVTYVSPHGTSGRKPSHRYLGLLLEGAREHGLPAEYVSSLEALELAVDERVKA